MKNLKTGFLLMLLTRLVPADDLLDHWTVRNPLPTGDFLWAVTYGNGQYVAINSLGSAISSVDGRHWTRHAETHVDWAMRDLTFANGSFTAVGGVGTNAAVFCSVDGVHWAAQALASPFLLFGVSHVNGRYVAVGAGGLAFTSTNRVKWDGPLTISGFGNALAFSVTASADQFVAVGNLGRIASSPDGITWNSRTSGTRGALVGVTFANNLFVAVGGNSVQHGIILTSPDGVAWTQRSSGTDGNFGDVTYANGRFVAVGQQNDGPVLIRSSVDGIKWNAPATPPPFPTTFALRGIDRGNGLFVAVGESGALAISLDADTWSSASSGLHSGIRPLGLAYGADRFVSVGFKDSSTAAVMVSADGYAWTAPEIDTSNLIMQAIAFGAGQFVAVGTEGGVVTSGDGLSWEKQNSDTSFDLVSVVYGNGTFVAIGNNRDFGQPLRAMLTSPDGRTWRVRRTEPGAWLTQVAFGGGQFVAVGNDGAVTTSPDGIVWELQSSGTSDLLPGVAYGNGHFVVPAVTNTLVSYDGAHWTQYPSETMYGAACVTFGGGLFVAPAGSDLVYTSLDGIQWLSRSTGISQGASAIAYGEGQFVFVAGTDGVVGCDIRPHVRIERASTFGNWFVQGNGVDGISYSLESSLDLTDWTAIGNQVATEGRVKFVVSPETQDAKHFYRVSASE